MNPVFEKQYEVGFNEVDVDGMIGPVNLLNWFQNTASSQSYSLGIPVTDLISRGLTWVVYRYKVLIVKRPRWRDPVRVRTWRRPQEEDLSAPREFEVLAADGSVLAQATALFKLVDISSKKAVSPNEAVPNYPVLDKRLFPFDSSITEKFDMPDIGRKFDVRRGDLDMNRHVNNVNYVAWAMETVPDHVWDNFWASGFEVLFRKPAFFPDSLLVRTSETGHDPKPEFIHEIQRGESVLAVVKTVWTRR